MNVVVLHYHFDRGGVTRVVESTLAGFADRPDFRFGLLSGRPVRELTAPARVLPDLDYHPPKSSAPDPDKLHREILSAARDLFEGVEPDLWHIHNPALGKNAAMSGVVARLARDGRALLLHEHDFAEDFRPINYRLRENHRSPEDPSFPYSERVAYGVLNERDHRILTEAGVPEDLCRLLPNPVPAADSTPEPDPDSDLILYPVRALARKNLGEFLLLSHLLRDRFRFESTLPPTNPAYQNRFERWKALTNDLSLPARLGTSSHDPRSFPERMAESRAIITTSIAEGFGLGFLEPWTFNRPVIGRDLPEITGSFRNAGVDLEHLYSRFPVPKSALADDPAPEWTQRLTGAFHEFESEPDSRAVQEAARELFDSDEIDFSLLSEENQERTLRRICEENLEIRPPLDPARLPDRATIASAAASVQKSYHLSQYTDRLESFYRTLVAAPGGKPEAAEAGKVLSGFLNPFRFHPHFFPQP